jgi:SAM-dependent methyltransferase
MSAMHTACPACGRAEWRPLPELPPFQRCGCGLVGNAGNLDEDYDAGYFIGDGATGHRDFDSAWARAYDDRRFVRALEEIERLERGRRLLDVGSATGAFLRRAVARGWDAVGVEVSAHARAASVAEGLHVVPDLTESARLGSYDVATMHHVLEHLEDPVAVLTDVRLQLRSGALLWVEVPNFASAERRAMGRDWVDLRPEQHRWQFSPRSLVSVIRRAGFREPHVFTMGEPIPTKRSVLASVGVNPKRVERLARSAEHLADADSVPSDEVPRTPASVRAAARVCDALGRPLRLGRRLIVRARAE